MNKDIDAQLRHSLLTPPEDFTQRVMQEIALLPLPERAPQASRWKQYMQWLTCIGAGLFGATQLVTFIFGIWTVSVAG